VAVVLDEVGIVIDMEVARVSVFAQHVLRVAGDVGEQKAIGDGGSVGLEEGEGAVVVALRGETALVEAKVVAVTSQDEVVFAGGAAVEPVLDVVSIEEGSLGAPRELAMAVPHEEHSEQLRRDGASAAADVEGVTAVVGLGDGEATIAGEALEGVALEGCSVVELGGPALFVADARFAEVDEELASLRGWAIPRNGGVAVTATTTMLQPCELLFGHGYRGVGQRRCGG
jgi:hypothetical protein